MIKPGFLKYDDPGKQERYDRAYLRMALEWGKLSHCDRRQVGAIIVKEGTIIADGYNGTPTGFPNVCEDENYETHWYVLHAEANAIMHCAILGIEAGSSNAILYTTFVPCLECTKMAITIGIKKVVCLDTYPETDYDLIKEAGIEVITLDKNRIQKKPKSPKK